MNDNIIGFGNRDTQFINHDGFYIVTVRLNHSHLETRHPNVKIGHRRRVDQAQAHLFTRPEHTCPVLYGALAVNQGCETLDIFNIRWGHPHLTPHPAFFQSGLKPICARIRDQVFQRALRPVVVIRRPLQVAENLVTAVWVLVGKLNHIIAICADRIATLGFDHNGTVCPIGFLKTGVAVKPISAGLFDRKIIGVCRAGLDSDKADIWHPVLFE